MGNESEFRRLGEPGEAAMRTTLRARVHDDICRALITGRIVPGRGITLRGLAQQLGVSPMPVREAVHQLAAERALSIGPTGRIHVPEMTPGRFNDLIRARLLLEPEAARMALPKLGRSGVPELRSIDDGINQSLVDGDVEAYMRLNHAFHFHIYRAAGSEVFIGLIESVWLQFGPFMRTVYGRLGTASLIDQHELAIAAIAAGDPLALGAAISRDITDGMDVIGPEILPMPASA